MDKSLLGLRTHMVKPGQMGRAGDSINLKDM